MGRTRTTVKVEPVPKRWLNKQEAMSYLGVGEDYLTKLRNEAKIHFYMASDGKKIWYEQKELDRYVQSCKVF